MRVPEERWSCLVIRVWSTEGEAGTFRARLIELSNVDAQQETLAVADDPSQVLAVTRRWLERVADGVAPSSAPPG